MTTGRHDYIGPESQAPQPGGLPEIGWSEGRECSACWRGRLVEATPGRASAICVYEDRTSGKIHRHLYTKENP